jgi:signal recognition particle subunit SEC65
MLTKHYLLNKVISHIIFINNLLGRRVPKEMACEDPKVEFIAQACRILKFEILLERNKSYPK